MQKADSILQTEVSETDLKARKNQDFMNKYMKQNGSDEELKRLFTQDEVNSMKNHQMIELSRKILEKPPCSRTNTEIGRITEYLKNVPFFKDRRIRDKDLDELVGAFHFEIF
jgi:hypothetical protein